MKVVYCCTLTDLEDLKKKPTEFTSSKISTLHIRVRPHFAREFLCIKNIQYIKLPPAPALARLWDDMMSKRTFSYNFEHLHSQALIDEYRAYNQTVAAELSKTVTPQDLVVVNDASLFLLGSLLNCRTAVRNIKFDGSFIERVPFSDEILRALFKVHKFFASRQALMAFNAYVDTVFAYWNIDRGGCWYMKPAIDKDAVYEILQALHAHCQADELLEQKRARRLREKVAAFLAARGPPCHTHTVLTNAPLLHLESFIKHHPRVAIRMLRDTVVLNNEQDTMVQYLQKAYDCRIDIVDTHDFDTIVLEMLYCDAFVGTRYIELARLLRRSVAPDMYDPVELRTRLERCIGELQDRMCVHGEDEYLKDFMAINGYRIQREDDAVADDAIDALVLQCLDARDKQVERPADASAVQATPSVVANVIDNSTDVAIVCRCGCHSCTCQGGGLYERVVKGRRVLFRRLRPRKGAALCNACRECAGGCAGCAASAGAPGCAGSQGVTFTAGGPSPVHSELSPVAMGGSAAGTGVGTSANGAVADVKAGQGAKDVESPEQTSCTTVDGSNDTEKQPPEISFAEDERSCFCNNGRGYADGRNTQCDCGAAHTARGHLPIAAPRPSRAVPLADRDAIRAKWASSEKTLLLDYDGTLTGIVARPEDAAPSAAVLDLLRRLAAAGRCVLCTGRSKNDVDAWFPPEIEVFAEHGALHRANGQWDDHKAAGYLEECRDIMRFYAEKTPGSQLEEKTTGCAFHFRNAPEFRFEGLFGLLRRVAGDAVWVGKCVLEVRAGSKGSVAQHVRPVLCAGDDTTDEEMYGFCTGVSIKVGPEETSADCHVETTDDLISLLEYVCL